MSTALVLRAPLRPAIAECYNETVRDLEVPLGDCPAAFVTRHLLDPARLRETWYKWFLVREVERLGRLPELVLPGVDIKDVDKVFTDFWNER